MNFTKKIALIAFAGMAVSDSCLAEEFSTEASATLVSQYLWRGFELNQEDPALQGDFMVSHDSGFSFGVWGSNYDAGGGEDGVELDFMASYETAINDDITLGLGVSEYTYSGDIDSSTEVYVSAAFKQYSVSYFDDLDLDINYLSIDAEFELAEDYSLALHYGNNDPDGGQSNSDYSLGINYAANKQLKLFALYSDNDLNVVGAEDYLAVGLTYSF